MNNLVDSEIKEFYQNQGLNVTATCSDKYPVNANGVGFKGSVKTELVQIEYYILESEQWGIKHSTDSKAENIIFLDWDHGKIDDSLKKLMLTYREKPDGTSYHGIIRVMDADRKWIKKFVKDYSNSSLELFCENKNLMMFGSYAVKGSDKESKWRWIDSVKEHTKLIEVTKSDLGELFSKQTKKSKHMQSVPAGQGLRHQAILAECFQFIENANDSERTPEVVENHIFQSVRRIENLQEYEAEPKHQELVNIIKYALDNYQDVGLGYTKKLHNWASMELTGWDNQFNCWYYDRENNNWNEETAKLILKELKDIDIESVVVSSGAAIEISKRLSVDEDSLKVTINDEYMKKRYSMIIDDFGNYFDLESGEIKKINPVTDFFTETDVSFELKGNTEIPEKFEEFLKARCGDSWEIARDHLASIFLHNSLLGSKPKMMYLVGENGTYKSFLISLIRSIVKSQSNVPVSRMASDNFASALLANKLLNYSEEESVSMVENQAQLKDVITKDNGLYRNMHTTKQSTAYRFPRWIVACNKILPLAKNDENSSMLIRTNYIKIKPVENEPDWYTVFDGTMRQDIMMYLINRAFEIHTDPSINHDSKSR